MEPFHYSCGCQNGDSTHSHFGYDASNYEPWQRKVKKPQSSMKFSKSTKKVDLPSNSHIFKGSLSHAQEEEEKQQAKERCTILEAQLISARQSLALHLKREKELVESNLQIIDKIDGVEGKTHADVKQLLRKYEKFRNGMATLNANFLNDLAEATQDLEIRKELLDSQIRGLEKQVEELNERLTEKQTELSVLSTYKDKEYPVKAMMISNFQTELDNFKHSNQADQEELEHIIKTELGKYEKERVKISNNVIYKVIVESVSLMHPSIKDTALQNVVMKKEIEFHRKNHEEIAQVNKQLKSEIESLLKSPKTNLRLQLFPEFFPTREKCTPDMELTFDIPTQDWLPI